uniref:Uncharacterized protein n=1 Tax=Setaria viridis TaxID=4556 RepID=A0A4U6VCG5_SETVI|nr:hypothetical protein SEVIR_3G227433v2 [Setaria viridis]
MPMPMPMNQPPPARAHKIRRALFLLPGKRREPAVTLAKEKPDRGEKGGHFGQTNTISAGNLFFPPWPCSCQHSVCTFFPGNGVLHASKMSVWSLVV